MKVLLAILLAVGCRGVEAGDDPPREPPQRPELRNERMVRYHMQRHFDDLKTVERMLIDGHFEDAKTLAFMLTKPSGDSGLKPWDEQSRDVVAEARALTAARDIPDALRRLTRVSAACASCHLSAQSAPVFRTPSRPPQDQPTTAARMARHAWAVDRLWEGMVAASDHHWRAGLDVLRATPVPSSPRPELGERMQVLARGAFVKTATTTLEDRAASYAEMLGVCAGCHASLRKPAR
jgi:mono/diheme cytochrome c family protein